MLTVALAGTALAYDEEDLARLARTMECWECDLSSADLKGANLKVATLT